MEGSTRLLTLSCASLSGDGLPHPWRATPPGGAAAFPGPRQPAPPARRFPDAGCHLPKDPLTSTSGARRRR
eukprot:1399999-Alexandrium_andersonii.AAC.1